MLDIFKDNISPVEFRKDLPMLLNINSFGFIYCRYDILKDTFADFIDNIYMPIVIGLAGALGASVRQAKE